MLLYDKSLKGGVIKWHEKVHIDKFISLNLLIFLTDYEKSSPKYDEAITASRGKMFVLERDNNGAL